MAHITGVYIYSTVYFHACLYILTMTELLPNKTLPVPLDWDSLCPYTDFCTHKAARSTENLTNMQRPCCTTCSCDDDCGLRRNCCQEFMDRYRLDEKYKSQCISLTFYGPNSVLRDGNTYMVVVECPDTTSCYKFEAAPWGSMYPVVSETSKMIYLNKQCALCHGEVAVSQWDAMINCQSDDASHLFISEGLKTALYGTETDTTQYSIRFSPPKHIDVSFQYCKRNEVVRSCEYKEKIEKKEIIQLCESFNASYTYMTVTFANIYCYLCAATRPFTVPNLCAIEENRRAPISPLTLLLTPEQVTDLSRVIRPIVSEEVFCSGQNEVQERQTGKCRKRRCPEGQLEMGGQCSFISPKWTFGPLVTFLKLTPIDSHDSVPRDDVMKMSTTSSTFYKSRLKAWDRNIYHYTNSNATDIQYFVLELQHKRRQMNIKSFLDDFKIDLDSPWPLNIADKVYAFNAEFYKYYDFTICRTTNSSMKPKFRFTSEKPENPCETSDSTVAEYLEEVKITPTIKRIYQLSFTKFFFCNQVDLLPEEYEDYDARIFFKVKNKFLEKAEFRRLSNTDGSSTISVCLSDFGDNFWVMSGAMSFMELWYNTHASWFSFCILTLSVP